MDQPSESTIFDYSISPSMATNLKEAARWSRFLAIVGFILMGVLLIGGILIAPLIISLFKSVMPAPFPLVTGALIGIVIVIVLFGTFLYALLYRFATCTRTAMETNDEQLFIKGFRSLKIYFIIYGVFLILALLLNISSLFR